MAIDYKNTLNLPHTDFPMKASLAHREPQMLAFWQEREIYQQIRKICQGRKKFILHDGPPYANGQIHIGHALNKSLKDIIVKAKTLSGYDAPYVPGWDCHGLPIELNVEKKIGKPGQKVSEDEFLAACRDYALSQIDIQRESFKRLGVFGDWENPYKTMDFAYEANIIRSLAGIIANGHLQRGSKPVHWCVACGSALAEAEVEYKDKQSPAIDVRFRVVDVAEFQKRFKKPPTINKAVTIPIWTTTPWTLPANLGVALNPEIEYVLLDTQDELLLVAVELLESVIERYEIAEHHVIAAVHGDALEDIQLQHPFLDKQVPILLGEHVTVDAGTGAVHTAPAHGQDDYVVCSRKGIEIYNPVDAYGRFTEDTPYFAGLAVFKSSDAIIEKLRENETLLHSTELLHSYPHCWRHKKPLIFRATPQWFISMEKQGLRTAALRAIDETEWLPAWGHGRIADMVAKRPDWCISRQRLWGTPLPLFIHKDSGEPHQDTVAIMHKVADIVAKEGIEAWRKLSAVDFLGDQADQYIKVTDSLDVWFDAGVSHCSVLEHREELQYPADVYLEGSDQYRGWFHSSLLTSVAMHDKAPYKTVITHGFTVDAKGYKMSKSLGNTITPDEVWNKLGADILRLWVASTDYSGEISVSDEILKRVSDTYRRIRNTARFLLSNLADFTQDHLIAFDELLSLDRWAIDRTLQLQNEIIEAYDQFQFHKIYHKIHNFCTKEMGGFYLDIIKDRVYTLQENSRARRSAQTAMYHVLQAFVRWLAPILSFTAEEIWQHMPWREQDSVFMATWYDQLQAMAEDETMGRTFWQDVMVVRDEVNKALEETRNQGKIGSPLEAEVTLYAEQTMLEQLQQLGDELRFVFITSKAECQLANGKLANHMEIQASSNHKCERCWHRREDVGQHSEHPTICGRCVENIAGKGETRSYA